MNRKNTKDLPIADEKIMISMLGNFEIRVGDSTVSDSDNRSQQLWLMLEYLVAFHNRDISHSELIEALWPDDSSGNPANALKNLVYRIRTVLHSLGMPYAKEIIVSSSGSYSWNKKLLTVVDCEEFERHIKHAESPNAVPKEQIGRYMEAIQLYKGDFLPKSACEPWVVPISTYYHSLYINSVHRVAELLSAQGRYSEIVGICEAAILIDRFDEGVHETLIRTLISLKMPQRALAHYEHVTTLFYNELGVKPSEALRSLYRVIVNIMSHVETNLDTIKEDLDRVIDDGFGGAFVCEYEVFRDMYHVMARSAVRSGDASFIGLLTLVPDSEKAKQKKQQVKGMEQLLKSICISLRRGDTVARFSPTQYVMILTALTYENGQMVTGRITKQFKQENPRAPFVVSASLQPVDPLD